MTDEIPRIVKMAMEPIEYMKSDDFLNQIDRIQWKDVYTEGDDRNPLDNKMLGTMDFKHPSGDIETLYLIIERMDQLSVFADDGQVWRWKWETRGGQIISSNIPNPVRFGYDEILTTFIQAQDQARLWLKNYVYDVISPIINAEPSQHIKVTDECMKRLHEWTILWAKYIKHTDEEIDELIEDARKSGHRDGVTEGYDHGYEEGLEVGQEKMGFLERKISTLRGENDELKQKIEDYKNRWGDRFKHEQKIINDKVQEQRQKVYDDGFCDGFSKGYTQGFSDRNKWHKGVSQKPKPKGWDYYDKTVQTDE